MKYAGWMMLLAMVLAVPALARAEQSLAQILEQQRTLQADLDAGKVGDMTPRQVNAVRRAQKEVFAVAEGKTGLDDLDINEKIRLENALERINADYVGTRVAGDQKETCWRETITGSKTMTTRCGTQQERDQAREGARAWMEKPKVCVPPSCGG